MLIFIRKSEVDIMNSLKAKFIEFTGSLFEKELSFAKIQSSAMLEEKYIYFGEVKLSSKEETDKKLQTGEGREFNKFLGETGNLVTVYFADYSGK